MSQPVSPSEHDSDVTSTSVYGSDVTSTISFNRPGEWGARNPAEGPALVLPASYAGLKLVGSLFVEFLQVDEGSRGSRGSTGSTGSTGKNHVVLRAPLEMPIKIEGKTCYAVRIGMDLADEEFLVLDDSEVGAFYDAEKEPGSHYYPGQLTVKFLRYSTPTSSQQHTLGFPILQAGLTLGALVNVAKEANIYKFVFLPYPGLEDSEITVWKGCRDFILQFWLLLVARAIIADQSTDDVNLTDSIPFVCNEGQAPRPQPVDKGDFIRFHRDCAAAHVRIAYGVAAER